MKKTETHILAVAMHSLASHINTEDGVASAAIREAGDRLLELERERDEARKLAEAFHTDQGDLIVRQLPLRRYVRIGPGLEQQVEGAFVGLSRDEPGPAITPAQRILEGRQIEAALRSGGAVALGTVLLEDRLDVGSPEIGRRKPRAQQA